jgi:hypothetical protein
MHQMRTMRRTLWTIWFAGLFRREWLTQGSLRSSSSFTYALGNYLKIDFLFAISRVGVLRIPGVAVIESVCLIAAPTEPEVIRIQRNSSR